MKVARPYPEELARTAKGGGHPTETGRVGSLLRTPLFYRLLAVNGVVVALGAVVGSYLAVRIARASPDLPPLLLASALALAGVALSVGLSALLVRWTLSPLSRLVEAAERIQAGGEPGDERVPVPADAAPELARLIRVFNEMVHGLSRHRARLRGLAVRALEATEAERLQLAGILQDDTAQRLAACLLHLRLVRRLPAGDERERALDAVRDEAGEVLESVRRLARSLYPPELEDIGLESAIRALGRQVAERGGPAVRLELSTPQDGLEPAARLALYRGVEEALLNAQRHAGASRIEVRLREDGDRVRAEVEDDGQGFDATAAMDDMGMPALGLLGMRERMRDVGGLMEVDSDPGRGTRVRLEVPVAGPAGGRNASRPSA